jgi:uncharacterized protein (TIGR00251 family)
MSWIQREASGTILLRLHVRPAARNSEIVGPHGDALKIRLAAPPVDGRANACLIEFIAERLKVPCGAVELVSGAASRQKRLRVRGASDEALANLLS